MGGVVRGLFGSSGESGGVADVTPIQFRRLRDPFEANLRNILGNLGTGQPGAGLQFEGPTTAPLGGGEQHLINLLGGQGTREPSPLVGQSQDFLQRVIGGQFQPQGVQPVQVGPLPGVSPVQVPENQGVTQFQGPTGQTGQVLGQTIGGAFLPGQGEFNPFLQETIQAASRPLLEQFQEVTLPRLRGAATQAGQQVGEGASSPFDFAAARAQSGLANALGDVGTRLAGQAFEAERGRQQQALLQDAAAQQQAGLLAQQLNQQAVEAGLGRQQQAGLAAQQLGQQGALQTQQLGTQAGLQAQQLGQQAQQAERDRRQQAALTGPQLSEQALRSQMDRAVQALQAQALPRLIEDQGVERGLELFNTRLQTLFQALGLAGQVGQPTPQGFEGRQGTPGLFGNVLSSAGTAFGRGLGGMFF